VWAVGFTLIGSPPLIEHWNGTSWRTVKAPKQAGVLNGVTAVSTNDVWAVGDFINASGVQQTLIEQWNGKKWSVVSSPNVGTQPNELFGVTAVSTTDPERIAVPFHDRPLVRRKQCQHFAVAKTVGS